MIGPDIRAQIRHYFYAEHWKIGTIASELGVHADTVHNSIEAERLFSAAFDLSQRRRIGSGFMYPSTSDTASAAVGREISQTGAMITRRNLNVQPTIKVSVGYRFTVRVNRDILFEAPYEPLQADPQPWYRAMAAYAAAPWRRYMVSETDGKANRATCFFGG